MSLPPNLVSALTACKEVAVKTDGVFCYSLIEDSYKAQGVRPWHLKELAKRGYLTRAYGTRGGHRAHYRLNPDSPR
jgi:hypothetical protein